MNEDKFFELAEKALKILADIEKRLEEVEKRLEQNSKPKIGGGSPAYEPIPYWLHPSFKMPDTGYYLHPDWRSGQVSGKVKDE